MIELDFSGLDNIKGTKEQTQPIEVKPEERKAILTIDRDIQKVEEAKRVYKEYQNNIRVSEELRSSILKATNKNTEITEELFFKAIKIVSLLCHEPTFYEQIKKNLIKNK